MSLVKLNGVPELDRALDYVAAAVPSDATIHIHSIDPAIVGVSINGLLHVKEASTFGSFLDVRDQIVELPDGALATPCLKRFFGWNRADNSFESCYTAAIRETFPALIRLGRVHVDAIEHGLGDKVDDVRPAAQAMTLRMDIQNSAQDFDGSIVRRCIIRHEVLHLLTDIVVLYHSQDLLSDTLTVVRPTSIL